MILLEPHSRLRCNVGTLVKAERNVPSITVELVLFYDTKSYRIFIHFSVGYDLVVHFNFIISNCLFILFSFPFLFYSFPFPSFLLLFLFLLFSLSSLPSSSPTLSLQIMCFDSILRFSKLLLQRNNNYFRTFLGSLGFPAHSFSGGA